ncbi:hypothetical protein E3P88_01261 [Wallemia ichthyophaga]|uniref:Tetra-spanning protein 1 n=1 Tax=Wallemia ichthyophaga (strain EXF-994 / CBS 113033) TaxID=1299270 RepID=R9ABV4_WALI9|nr:Tetra-spanning protein 1 [Wallemia ichthyophaga EXF-994]TIA75882.1 hypothetical protein E3P91_00231 [Wallemia ichthyophaga]EOQ99641.1 Tetra-spanning protein 1 [Wallemia ichthyophaga EXF-994]TIB26095.1 hypothetical protein E3P88_01261 [Wallemia ichthyophaga]TIB42573.1 hypothetical protein E3P83_01109 [Wallemia ichthyophaga]TIB60544.1 hypothetical protein E3P79_01032 [Wallemia ichthyophaga]
MARSALHYSWAAGHAILFLSTLKYVLGLLTLKSGLIGWAYKLSYFGAIVSYGVVVFKSFGIPQANLAWVQRAMLDENVQYLILAAFFFVSKPIPLTLIPYATFSLFHILSFLKNTVIPLIFPPPPQSNATSTDGSTPPSSSGAGPSIQKSIGSFVKSNYARAMKFVSYSEMIVFLRLFFGALIFNNALSMPMFYALFLRSRYVFSPYTRNAFAHVGARIDGLVAPYPQPARIWTQAKGFLARAGGQAA